MLNAAAKSSCFIVRVIKNKNNNSKKIKEKNKIVYRLLKMGLNEKGSFYK